MPTLNLMVPPFDPFQSIEQPPESGDYQQYSSYDDPYSRTGLDVSNIFTDFQNTYGRYAMINPIVDWYEVFYGGSSSINDLDIMFTSFDLMNAIFAHNNNEPRSWYTDTAGTYQTFVSKAAPVTDQKLASLNLTKGAPSAVPSGNNITVTGTLTASGYSVDDLRFISINLRQAQISQQPGPDYQRYFDSQLSQATSQLATQQKRLFDILMGHAADNDYTFYIEPTGRYVNTDVATLRHMWSNFEISIITGLDLPAGWAGFTDRKPDGSGWYANVETMLFVNYYRQNGVAGVVWFMIHEFVHNWRDVRSYYEEQLAAYRARTGDGQNGRYTAWGPTQIEFQNTERFTNEVYRQFATQQGFPVLANPPGGYFNN